MKHLFMNKSAQVLEYGLPPKEALESHKPPTSLILLSPHMALPPSPQWWHPNISTPGQKIYDLPCKKQHYVPPMSTGNWILMNPVSFVKTGKVFFFFHKFQTQFLRLASGTYVSPSSCPWDRWKCCCQCFTTLRLHSCCTSWWAEYISLLLDIRLGLWPVAYVTEAEALHDLAWFGLSVVLQESNTRRVFLSNWYLINLVPRERPHVVDLSPDCNW